MKYFIFFCSVFLFFAGCSKEPHVTLEQMSRTQLVKSDFDALPGWEQEDYEEALKAFKQSCITKKTRNIYGDICRYKVDAADAKEFLLTHFTPYKIESFNTSSQGLLTGYYEPYIRASRTKKDPYIYPIYKTPKDMLIIDLSTQYPELKKYRLRGRVQGKRVVPYYDREEASGSTLDAEILCYTDSKIDLFFLEVQGSGRAVFEDGSTIFLGYENQNGHPYSSIGKYLVDRGEIPLEKISLQSIKKWLEANPQRIDEVLNYNRSMVFFTQKEQSATGALGVELIPQRSVAVDREYIPLGSMLYLSAKIENPELHRVVMAQDTGGAIKGSVRADIFMGHTQEAKEIAGKLKAPLELWIFLPKEES